MENRDFIFNGNKYSLAWEYTGKYKVYHWELMERVNDSYFPLNKFKSVLDAVTFANNYRASYYQQKVLT